MTNETITTDTQNTFYQTVNELEEAMKTQKIPLKIKSFLTFFLNLEHF